MEAIVSMYNRHKCRSIISHKFVPGLSSRRINRVLHRDRNACDKYCIHIFCVPLAKRKKMYRHCASRKEILQFNDDQQVQDERHGVGSIAGVSADRRSCLGRKYRSNCYAQHSETCPTVG